MIERAGDPGRGRAGEPGRGRAERRAWALPPLTVPPRPWPREAWALLAVLAAWIVVLVVGLLLYLVTPLHLGVIPFHGGPGFGIGIFTPVAIAVGALLVTAGPGLAARLPFGRLALLTWPATIAWSASVAGMQSWLDLSGPLQSRYDYYQVLPDVHRVGLHEFLATYTERLGAYPIHVQGHPPGMVVLLRALEVIGLGGPGWAAAVIIVIGASAPVAVLLAARALCGETAARQAAPFLVAGPWVLFVATVADGVYAAVAAWAITAVVLAATRRPGAGAVVLALLGGAFGSLALHGTYGLVPLLAALMGTVIVVRRRWWLVVPVALGGATATVPWVVAGFWWLDGLDATRHWYAVSSASERPYLYFLVANLVAFAIILGPGVVAALSRGIPRDVAVLVVPTLVAVAVADLSGLSKAEVERIWLPFVPWITLVVVGLVRRRPEHVRAWLAGGVGLTLLLQSFVTWPW